MAVGASARYGYNSSVGVAEETTFGTKVDSFSYLEFVSESFNQAREEIKIESINKGRDFIKRLQGNETVEGNLETHLNPAEDAIVYMIKQCLGGTVSSSAITTTVDDQYLHTLNVGDMESNAGTSTASDVKSLSFQVDKGGIVRDFVGGRINSMSVKCEIGSPAMISFSVVGQTASITTSTPTAVFTDVRPVNFTGITFETGDSLGNLSAETIQSFELTINNNIATDTRGLGTRTVNLLPPLRREVMLKVSQRADTTTAHSIFLAETVTAIRITCDSEQTITSASSGAQTHKLIMDLPRCYYSAGTLPEVSGVEVLMHELEISALSNNTTTAFPVQFKIQNGTASYL